MPEPPARPRVWPVFVAFVLAQALGGVVAALVLALVVLLQHGAPTLEHLRATALSVPGLLSTLTSTMIVLAGVALGAAALSPVAWRRRLRLHAAGTSAAALWIGTAGALGVSASFAAFEMLGLVPRSEVFAALERIIEGLTLAPLLATVVVIGILPGIAEELLFRGYIQTRLGERLGAGWAILCTSLLFGLMHMELAQGAFAVLAGVYLGFLTERSGSIVPAMVAHAANNTVATLLTAVGFAPSGRAQPAVVLALGAIGLVVALSAVSYFRMRWPASRASAPVLCQAPSPGAAGGTAPAPARPRAGASGSDDRAG